ncbi:MAG: hypothetical protein QOI53_3474 [Verrucomicrobiota bacterium]|jgi:hypothetical protein|nr:hypothetical protein [Verrucomicrobiota bacterium]
MLEFDHLTGAKRSGWACRGWPGRSLRGGPPRPGPVRDTGVIQSFLQPLDKTIPMVATADVGRVAAELL